MEHALHVGCIVLTVLLCWVYSGPEEPEEW